MSKGPVRRSQLIAPFGVGALMTSRDGISLITCGLDHWYKSEKQNSIDPFEFEIEEWRLQQELGVSHFRLPPEYRTFKSSVTGASNLYLKIPFQRFPLWHFCPSCHELSEQKLHYEQKLIFCSNCETNKKWKIVISQVPFIAMCSNGHIQDFPWREWVHKSLNPKCTAPLKLISTGDPTLAGQKVVCEACGLDRPLANITTVNNDGTSYLSENLSDKDTYYCLGKRPWHGDDCGEGCRNHLVGTLRNASNLYFANVKSAIYLPKITDESLKAASELLETPEVETLLKMLKDLGALDKLDAKTLLNRFPLIFKDVSESLLNTALANWLNPQQPVERALIIEDSKTAFKRSEFLTLKQNKDDDLLKIKVGQVQEYENEFQKFFSSVSLISKLRETRALTGFDRAGVNSTLTDKQKMQQLWLHSPPEKNFWLPAYVVYGEGIFIEFNETRMRKWENDKLVKDRLNQLIPDMSVDSATEQILMANSLSRRFILLHSFSHVLMNRLIYDCGYSSASLRERIFSSTNLDGTMAGLLIYTAAGDSEGTMGGLVRMGKPGSLELIVKKAIEDAGWCSLDPVCMESGLQGPNSCNLAACHNCGLVPETACEEMNKFLDRASLVGSITSDVGYFNPRFD